MQQNTDTDWPAAPPIKIDHVIAQLAGHQAYLAAHIDRHWDGLEPLQLARTLSLYGQNAARLGRLFLDRAAMYGSDLDERMDAFIDMLCRADQYIREHPELVDADYFSDPVDAPGKDDATVQDTQDAADDAAPAQPSPEIDDVITALAASQDRLSRYLDRHRDGLEPHPMERFLAVYSQNATRLGRLLRSRSDIYGPPPDPIQTVWDQALDAFRQDVEAGKIP